MNFYYTVENQNLGIRISFAIIYITLVTLLLFLSITIAIRFSSRFFRSINNLILASTEIGQGNLNSKVPEIKTDKDMEILNKNSNKWKELKPKKSQIGKWRVEEEFINAIKGKEKISHTTFSDGVKYMQFADALKISSESNRKVYLPLSK